MARQPRHIRIEGDVAYVPLTKGYEAVIDAADVPLVEGVCWTAAEDGNTVYAYRRAKATGTIRMHRLLMGSPPGLEVDHRDGNGLNNRRGNLRVATTAQNQWNRGPAKTSKSGIKGIRWHKNRWAVLITHDGLARYLGRYRDIETAKAVFAKATFDLRGEFGRVE